MYINIQELISGNVLLFDKNHNRIDAALFLEIYKLCDEAVHNGEWWYFKWEGQVMCSVLVVEEDKRTR